MLHGSSLPLLPHMSQLRNIHKHAVTSNHQEFDALVVSFGLDSNKISRVGISRQDDGAAFVVRHSKGSYRYDFFQFFLYPIGYNTGHVFCGYEKIMVGTK